ncbi:MAG: hypothetical protein F4Y80_17305 [Caldilineaceae bacterium SB0665_bin_21]|nr:hypothetical protein [Caldilineaceae bacterium SB0665_bin_21]MYC61390.1 hypothetical protein [Caldilineaceae bacterium SB0661_bin_34]
MAGVKIPVRNIYYLLCYAWDHIGEGETIDVGSEEFGGLVDLFAKVLNDGVARLVTRGLDRDYLTAHQDIRGLKGKLDLATTVQRNLLLNGKTHCAFDELSYDVPQNRILKATLHGLTLVSALDPNEKRRTEHLYRKLDAVSHVRLTASLFRAVRIHRNNRFYSLLLHLCRIIHENLLVNEEEGTAQFRDFREDEHQMGLVFQQFVKAFCKRETHYEVSAPQIDWFGTEGSETDRRHLPRMHTDIMLRSPARTIIVDTKFYKNPLNTRSGEKRVHSDHLYQIFAYVTNWSAADPSHDPEPEGMLLYAAVDGKFDYRFELVRRRIRACSIDLSQEWREIETDLRALVHGDE